MPLLWHSQDWVNASAPAQIMSCRWATLGKYPTWELLMREWIDGIRYAAGNKQTVPMEQLERELQKGVNTT